MNLTFVYLVWIVGAGVCDRDRPYINFKLMKITARNSWSLNTVLERLQNIDDLKRDHVDNTVLVLVPPDDVKKVSRVVTEEDAEAEIIHESIQDQVDDEYRQMDLDRQKRQVFTLKELTEKYMALAQIYGFQYRVMASCKNLAKVERKIIGYSANKRPITLMKISKRKSVTKKKTIFIESGMHAREWLSPATASYIIYQLACNKAYRRMLDLYNWEIIPVVNPDGYRFSHTKGNRFWRKNRQKNAGSKCIGTDLNRNFGAGFGRRGSSANVCSDTYRGKRAYSAPESTALRNYVMRNRKHIITYLSIHTYGQYIFLPWGYKTQKPQDYQNLMKLARTAEKAMGLPFKIGNTFNTIYPAAGISPDFARDKAGIALSYTWELMPNTGLSYKGFAPSETLVKHYTPIIWRGIRAYVQAVADQGRVILG